jgi:N-carbamoylputrescine amidase
VGGLRSAHAKCYLPDEEGFWEASWYTRGPAEFSPVVAAGARCGFLICTELWFLERARAYGREGVHLLVNPRGTLYMTREKWLLGGRAAAIVSGAFCLSSNRSGPGFAEPVYGGLGWVIGPEGDVLGLTTPDQPFVTEEVDLQGAELAKGTYPRYVKE